MEKPERNLKRTLAIVAAVIAMAFLGLAGGTAVFDSSIPISLSLAAAGIALMFAAASFLK